MSQSSPAADGVSNFLSILQEQTVQNVNCRLSTATRQICNVNEVNVTNCKNINLTCCNSSNVTEVMNCNASTILDAGVKAITNETSKNPDTQNYVMQKLNTKDPNTLTTTITTYLNETCKAFVATDQSINISLTAANCENDSIYLYNFSDVNIRCGAAAVSNLLPNPVEAPKVSFFTLDPLAKYILIGLGAGGVLFIILLIAFQQWRKKILKPVVAPSSLP
jgi:hypothetical protein